MAEGDTILRTARRLDAALAGQRVAVRAPNPRGRAAGVSRLHGARVERVESRGKHLLLHFDNGLVLHSHLGMNGSWQLFPSGTRWHKPPHLAWAVLSSGHRDAVQFGGSTLRLLGSRRLGLDPVLAKLGIDVLAEEFTVTAGARALRDGGSERELGEALLDQRLLAGVGNIFKSEGCYAASISPWRRLGGLDDSELISVVAATHGLMRVAVRTERQPRAVYKRAGRPCPRCRTSLRSRGQGDENRTTYWCPRCQP